jgi:hypothetical protein
MVKVFPLYVFQIVFVSSFEQSFKNMINYLTFINNLKKQLMGLKVYAQNSENLSSPSKNKFLN